MKHFAIDYGHRESQICICSAQGEIVEETRVATKSLKGRLRVTEPSVVVLETCTGAFEIARAAERYGHQVKVVPASLVRQLGVAERGIKNDRRDARALAVASARVNLPSVHIPSVRARELKAANMLRSSLVDTRRQHICRVRAYLRELGLTLRRGTAVTFPQRVRAKLQHRSEGVSEAVERVLKVIEVTTQQLREADKELQALANSEPVGERLMSIPGLGYVTCVRMLAAVDELERFEDAHQLQSYLGLTPGENTTGFQIQRTRITKAGQSPLRAALVQGAWVAMRVAPGDPMVQWAYRIGARRGMQIAVVALARKMAGIAYALWRDGTTYQPDRGAQPQPMAA